MLECGFYLVEFGFDRGSGVFDAGILASDISESAECVFNFPFPCRQECHRRLPTPTQDSLSRDSVETTAVSYWVVIYSRSVKNGRLNIEDRLDTVVDGKRFDCWLVRNYYVNYRLVS